MRGEGKTLERKGESVTENKTNMHLEPLILQNLLNGDVRPILRASGELRLEYDTKRPVSDDFAVRVGDVPRFTGLSVRGDDFYNLPGVIDGCKTSGRIKLVRHG